MNQSGRLTMSRSDTSLFGTEIKAVLAVRGPLRTKDIYKAIKAKFPEHCDDLELDKGNGEIAWKHRVRAAQEGLKKKNEIVLSNESKYWSVI